VPFARVEVLSLRAATVGAGAAIVSVRVAVAVWGVVSASLTDTLKVGAQLAVGVPLIIPLLESVNPAGTEPEATLQV
jgi:hypothetical protein